MVDTKPLLKGFGAAADVVGQIATDKAVNSRRLTATSSALAQSTTGVIDITNGQFIQGINLSGSGATEVPHDLGRNTFGAIVVGASNANVPVHYDATYAILNPTKASSKFQLLHNGSIGVDVWLF